MGSCLLDDAGRPCLVAFVDWTCRVLVDRYRDNDRICLRLIDEHDGPVARATVNLPGEALGEGELFIKDYAENEGMLDALERAGVVRRTGRTVRSGYAMIPVARLVVDLPKAVEPGW